MGYSTLYTCAGIIAQTSILIKLTDNNLSGYIDNTSWVVSIGISALCIRMHYENAEGWEGEGLARRWQKNGFNLYAQKFIYYSFPKFSNFLPIILISIVPMIISQCRSDYVQFT